MYISQSPVKDKLNQKTSQQTRKISLRVKKNLPVSANGDLHSQKQIQASSVFLPLRFLLTP